MTTKLKIYTNEDDALLFWSIPEPLSGCCLRLAGGLGALEQRGAKHAIRIPANDSLERERLAKGTTGERPT